MNHDKCEAFFSDKSHRFHELWGDLGWVVRHPSKDRTCWGDRGWKFFDDAWWGRDCQRNWYSGNGGDLGKVFGGPSQAWVWPHFSDNAPALLGFDESIDWYCTSHGGSGQHAEACVQANVNILSLYGDRIPYNICRNFEWQVCMPHMPTEQNRRHARARMR